MDDRRNHDTRFSEWAISRRQLLKAGGASALGLAARPWAAPLFSAEEKAGAAAKKILFFTKSAGYEHDVIKRKGDQLGHAENVFTELGKQHGFEVVATKDGRIFDGADFKTFDAFFFYTTGVLFEAGNDKQPPMSKQGKEALLQAVAEGKGFLGGHCASDSFHTPGEAYQNQEKPDPYLAMLGGEFISHGPQQKATMRVTAKDFSGCEKLGESFTLHEEWYSLKNFARDLRVILVNETKGMEGLDYQRPPFPATWIRRHHKGRVFYTSMGHREDVWTNPIFQGILLGGVAWVLGRKEVDTTANLAQAAPNASELPVKKKN
ncbi:MAG: ThuA domain-containing protein [Planctomycetes bacterium]|nr:ThuA domain-containing protein [Planctomycetota bacterium]